ncbi:phospholipid carrier-dependent glycosyltransferase [Patescibacteria group bacterium]|nr:phospholipid carrier-dependent glycosyltransferase [Patescibacteria group bacterium]
MSGRSSLRRSILIIIVLAAIIRFIGLSSLPPALNRDEAALGYNAYSILKTAKDEHGQFLPLSFKSIGDYKMPLYIYATIIPVKLFGLNDFSIRFWSALAGVVSVIMIYLITKKPLVAFLMALNPWAVFYSRIAFEANLALALFLVGLWLLLKKKPLGYIFWLLACLTYSSALIFIPLFFIFYYWRYRPKIIPSSLFLVSFSLIFIGLWQVSSQKQNITVFSDPYLIDTYNKERTLQYQKNPLKTKLFYNKYVYFGKIVAINYLTTFSPKFLVLKGDNHPWHQIPKVGNFYFLEIILALIGLLKLKKNRLLFFAWLLLAPLTSAITIDAPHSTRSIFLLPIILIFASAGLQKFKKFLPAIAIIYFINVAYVSYQYLKVYPIKVAGSLPVGLKEQLISLRNSSEPIYLTNVHDSTYLYPLVYLPIDPKLFQQTAVWTLPDTAGLTHAYQFANVTISD